MSHLGTWSHLIHMKRLQSRAVYGHHMKHKLSTTILWNKIC